MAARGFKRIEIASFGEYCFHFNFGSPAPGELKKMLDELNLTPVALNFFINVHQAWVPEQINGFAEEWRRKIAQLGEVGIGMITMSFGRRNDRDDQEYQLGNAVKAYDMVARIAEPYGVRLLLEVPHLYGLMPRTEQVLWVFERLDSSNIGALIDSSHWGIIGYDIDAFIAVLGQRLWHVHLRDSAGPDTADMKQLLELTPGDGEVDFRKFGEALDKAGYDADVTIEFEYRDMTLPAIEQEFNKGLAYLESVGWQLPEGVRKDV